MISLKNWVLVVRKPSAILEVKFFENEEFEIDDIEDAIEGEHCYRCDKWFRTGWNSS